MTPDEVDREAEEFYLTSEDAEGVWCTIRGWTNFNRWLMNPADRSMKYNQRLLYLLAAAIIRRVEHLVPDLVTDGCWRALLFVTEDYAEGKATPDEFYDACDAAQYFHTSDLPAAAAAAIDAVYMFSDDYKVIESIWHVWEAAGFLASIAAGELSAEANYEEARSIRESPTFLAGMAEEERVVCGLIRDIFGNPFRPVTFDPAWQTPAAVSLAQAAYEERFLPSGGLDPARLAVLSDALEEAGCTDERILSYLRSPGPHVRGCWPVDLILGKQ